MSEELYHIDFNRMFFLSTDENYWFVPKADDDDKDGAEDKDWGKNENL